MTKGGVVTGRISKGKRFLVWLGFIFLTIGFIASGTAKDLFDVFTGSSDVVSMPTLQVWGTVLLVTGPWIIKFGRRL